MFQYLVRWVNAISRLIMGVGVIELLHKSTSCQSAIQQAEKFAQKHQYIEALHIGEATIDDWYTSKYRVRRLFRPWIKDNFLRELKKHLLVWEPLAKREHDAALERACWLATEGRFSEAIILFEPVHQKFYQSQGTKLLQKLNQIIEGKHCFNLGFWAEKAGNWQIAQEHYQNAATISPEWKNECCIRLSIIAIKNEQWKQAIKHLAGINTQNAAYNRGFAYAKQGDWQKAHTEWACVSHPVVQSWRQHFLQQNSDRLRHSAKREIQALVDRENLWQAEVASRKFLKKFGDDSIVRDNLYKNILPRWEVTLWQKQNWQQIAKVTEQRWLDEWNITALHNWALASYYHAILNPSELDNLIVAWSTAIANLHLNPSLQHLSWLEETQINWQETRLQILQRLENLLKTVEGSNSEKYTKLFALYRLEVKALDFMGNPPSSGLRVRGLFITPGYYQRHHQKLHVNLLPGKLWALYTKWWQAVLACIEGDTFTAMQIRPQRKPSSPAETYAQKFVAYHEGCYYLDIQPGGYPRWRSAVAPLQLAKAEIVHDSQWLDNVEKLCQKQYQAISWNPSECQDLAQFWYDLIASPTAKYYLEQP
ncbi:tetratricopeptide repeat protein [Nostoc sp. CCY0012]|uniref:tetratricopeptide repeat protein n=1 Tax=Nostoc sp. CCY0012 TaxID=1056123 RepID=UPI0039C74875